ncbi:Frataxin, mitochondrial precursor [Phytophthora cinnamomi]|uniref:Frataxin, mitochondrial precursor n=1 Tax=Phytophthora cinnamomi TaxID=4785 RepID=UPI00355A6F08|nr:Frataxin, mitochondrial precursor [Phytophthora cinnamomi]
MLRRATLSSLRRACAPSVRSLSALPSVCRPGGAAAVPRRCQLQAARFSSDAPAPPHMSEHEFMELADETLHDIQSWLDGIEEMLEESDVMFSQGVLKIDLGEHGTWVINRQVPNRQIWWSSPISGPRRYEYDGESGNWVNTRDRGELVELLRSEILDATGIEIYEADH